MWRIFCLIFGLSRTTQIGILIWNMHLEGVKNPEGSLQKYYNCTDTRHCTLRYCFCFAGIIGNILQWQYFQINENSKCNFLFIKNEQNITCRYNVDCQNFFQTLWINDTKFFPKKHSLIYVIYSKKW